MHTPAHAAGEIARLMKAVREDRMLLDDTGAEQPLEPALNVHCSKAAQPSKSCEGCKGLEAAHPD